MAKTRRQTMRELRQEDFRERIAQHGVLTHLIDSVNEIGELDSGSETFREDLDKIKAQNDVRVQLLARYVPVLKAVDMNVGGELRAVVLDYQGFSEDDATGSEKPDP